MRYLNLLIFVLNFILLIILLNAEKTKYESENDTQIDSENKEEYESVDRADNTYGRYGSPKNKTSPALLKDSCARSDDLKDDDFFYWLPFLAAKLHKQGESVKFKGKCFRVTKNNIIFY